MNIENEMKICSQREGVRVYRKRWVILILFASYSASNAFQWINLGIISNVAARFYGVSLEAINWFSLVYMLVYIILIIPVTWLLDHKGLRLIALLGSGLNALGASIQIFSAQPHLYWLAMLGQTINATAQVFILGMPSKVSATWFEESLVSTAASVCVFGNQIGVGLGFLLTPIIVPDVDDLDVIRTSLLYLYGGTAAVTVVLFILVIFVFDERPDLPPSEAQKQFLAGKKEPGGDETYKEAIIRLITFTPSVFLIISYGVNVGAFYAISTLLNQEILSYFPDAFKEAGQIGFTMILTGIVGAILGGIILDVTKAFKATTRTFYLLSFLSMILYTATLGAGQLWVVFVTIGIMGFFLTGYLPIGFEYAAEITYPICEGSSSGLLNASAQTFGIFFILVMSALIPNAGVLGANVFLCTMLLCGLILTCLINADLKRSRANREANKSPPKVTSFSNQTFEL